MSKPDKHASNDGLRIIGVMPELSRDVVIQRLKDLRDTEVGGPCPDWMSEFNWAPAIAQLASAAVKYLEQHTSVGVE